MSSFFTSSSTILPPPHHPHPHPHPTLVPSLIFLNILRQYVAVHITGCSQAVNSTDLSDQILISSILLSNFVLPPAACEVVTV
jgi:hypothetical protein